MVPGYPSSSAANRAPVKAALTLPSPPPCAVFFRSQTKLLLNLPPSHTHCSSSSDDDDDERAIRADKVGVCSSLTYRLVDTIRSVLQQLLLFYTRPSWLTSSDPSLSDLSSHSFLSSLFHRAILQLAQPDRDSLYLVHGCQYTSSASSSYSYTALLSFQFKSMLNA